MTIKTDVEEVEKHTVLIKIEVPPEAIADHIKQAYREIARKVRIPGFRKGKAPRPIIDQMVGKDVVLEEALQDILPDIYPEAVKSAGIVPVTMPEFNVIQIKEDEPLIFTAKVQVKPEVELGDLKKLTLTEAEAVNITDEVNKELERLQKKFATLEVVKSRKSQNGDYVLIDYEGFIDGKPFEGGRGSDYMLELGSESFIAGFEDQLEGVKAGVQTEVKVTFPEDYKSEHIAGAEAVFKVTVKEIKSRKLPKADDDFAQSVSKFDTLKELKSDLKEQAAKKEETRRRSALRETALEKMVEISTVDLPGGMVERRIDQMVRSFADQMDQIQGIKFERWLYQTGMDLNQFRNNYKEEAIKGLKTELTLEAVAKQHELDATDEEIDAEIKRLAEGSGKDVEGLRKEIEEREGFEFLSERLSMDKAIDFLVEKAKIKKETKKDDVNDSSTDSN